MKIQLRDTVLKHLSFKNYYLEFLIFMFKGNVDNTLFQTRWKSLCDFGGRIFLITRLLNQKKKGKFYLLRLQKYLRFDRSIFIVYILCYILCYILLYTMLLVTTVLLCYILLCYYYVIYYVYAQFMFFFWYNLKVFDGNLLEEILSLRFW